MLVVVCLLKCSCGFQTHSMTARRSVTMSATMSSESASATISQSTTIKFSKYEGLGNDFIMVDARSLKEPPMSALQAAKLCDRNFGVGGDGVIFALKAESSENDFKMRIYNSDSSEPEMCGNGIRCLARYLKEELDEDFRSCRIETGAGLIEPTVLEDGRIAVDMGEPELRGPLVPTTLEPNSEGDAVVDQKGIFDFAVTCVSMGNPHCVTFIDDVASIDLATIGPQCEHHPAFPARVNTEFVQVIDRETLKMRVWERGAGATLACGTGACAVAVAGVLTGRAERHCTVQLPGGDLDIHWRQDDNRIIMTGPATKVFTGEAKLS